MSYRTENRLMSSMDEVLRRVFPDPDQFIFD